MPSTFSKRILFVAFWGTFGTMFAMMITPHNHHQALTTALAAIVFVAGITHVGLHKLRLTNVTTKR